MAFLRSLLLVAPFLAFLLEVSIGISEYCGVTKPTMVTLIMMLWMVIWWIFEFLPLGITALIPIIVMPATGILGINEVTAHYANPVVYLFLGGFMLACGLEKTKLNERIALRILSITGHSDKGIVLGFILATAFLSMWISNTATAVMMVPIAVSVLGFLETHLEESEKGSLRPMTTVVLLSIAYSANIGGVMTPVGTPPNVVFVGFLDQMYGIKIDFWKWMAILVPVGLVLSLGQFYLLNSIFKYKISIGPKFRSFVKGSLNHLGPMQTHQKLMLTIFSLVAFLWITKDLIHLLTGIKFLNDTSIAILGGVLLFLIPTSLKKWEPILDGKDISSLPWNIVLLFGGGIALASSLEKVGIIEAATHFFGQLDLGSPYVLVLVLVSVCLFLTEFMSNVALCVVALPVIMKLGEAQGIDPVIIGLPAAVATSFAFTMPISTPPNAIVFGTNQIRMKDMFVAGAILNLLGVIALMTVGWLLMMWLI
jgi:sodium-dependent dicarboxylate transporter 2/3/5